MARLVENVYGDALFELSVQENKMDAMFEEAVALSEVLDANPDLIRMLTHPHIDKEEKLQTVETVFKGKISDEIIGLMRMVVEKDHFGQMQDILAHFILLVKEDKKIGIGYVTTPLPLSDAKKRQIEERLLETTPYESLEMHYEEDASLIGGMVIRFGDRVVDSSIKTKIYQLSKVLSETQLQSAAK